MSPEKTFSFLEQVERSWRFIDALARRAWEREGLSQDQKKNVGDAAGQFYVQLRNATHDLPSVDPVGETHPPTGINVDDESWGQFALGEFVDMAGRRDVHSITEAYLKATYLLKVLDSDHRGYVFRGHRDISWDLVSRKGRELRESGWSPPSSHLDEHRRTVLLPEELNALEEFRARWDDLEEVDEIDKAQVLPEDSPEWWFRMQHYDTGNGTRMLDVTTSINAGLLFACVNWRTGELDNNQDGVLFLWSVGHNANTVDFLLEDLPARSAELFSGYPDAPVFVLNPPHNERSKAQSGAFYWWPRFWEEPPSGGPYYLRIPKNAKESVVTDLLKMGFGPKDAVRGAKGLENEKRLRSQLGFPSWEPVALRKNAV